ncbi:MAG TPA: hypothetical protein VFX50_10830, partial [Gemmatimonadales bacterium]|nr:hypothetical protein [Gemmatimonadales bacterium]
MAKLQRWVDLLAALLRRRYPITLEELEQEVPGYRKIQEKAARRRAFERDKDELRRFGVPLETVQEDEVAGYRIDRKLFYLPYISVIRDAQPTPVQESSKPWYLGLRKLAFEADELEAIAEAALRVRRLGIPA